MRNLLVYLGLVVVILTFTAPVLAKADKVTICHATSSETNPYVRIVVSKNAIFGHFENPGTPKAGHEDDILLTGEQDCPNNSTPPSIAPSLPPSDSPSASPSESPEGGTKGSGIPLPSDEVGDLPDTATQ